MSAFLVILDSTAEGRLTLRFPDGRVAQAPGANYSTVGVVQTAGAEQGWLEFRTAAENPPLVSRAGDWAGNLTVRSADSVDRPLQHEAVALSGPGTAITDTVLPAGKCYDAIQEIIATCQDQQTVFVAASGRLAMYNLEGRVVEAPDARYTDVIINTDAVVPLLAGAAQPPQSSAWIGMSDGTATRPFYVAPVATDVPMYVGNATGRQLLVRLTEDGGTMSLGGQEQTVDPGFCVKYFGGTIEDAICLVQPMPPPSEPTLPVEPTLPPPDEKDQTAAVVLMSVGAALIVLGAATLIVTHLVPRYKDPASSTLNLHAGEWAGGSMLFVGVALLLAGGIVWAT